MIIEEKLTHGKMNFNPWLFTSLHHELMGGMSTFKEWLPKSTSDVKDTKSERKVGLEFTTINMSNTTFSEKFAPDFVGQ